MTADRDQTSNLAADTLIGATAIATFLRGPKADRSVVYALIRKRSGIPVFRYNRTICARRSKLIAWIEAQERNATL